MRQAFTGTLLQRADDETRLQLEDAGAGVIIEFSPEGHNQHHLRGFIGKRIVIFIQDLGEDARDEEI